MNPERVWSQPPGYVTQMISRNYLALVVRCETSVRDLDVCATRSEDGRSLVLQAVNTTDDPMTLPLAISGFTPTKSVAQVSTLEGALDARNTVTAPETIKPSMRDWKHSVMAGRTMITLPVRSFTVVRW